MKQNAVKIMIPVVCSVSLLSGCTFAHSVATTLKTQAGSRTEYSIGEYDAADAADASADTAKDAYSSLTAETDLSSDVFSDRDLSAEYDEETIEIRLTGTGAAASSERVSVSGANVVITGEGTYLISGSLDNGSIVVDAAKEDKVQLVLNGVDVHAEDYAAIYVKQADKVFITLADGTENTLSGGAGFTQQDDNNVDAVIFSKDDLTLNGAGALSIESPAGHGIVGKDEVTLTGGVYTINAAKTAIRANDLIAVADGTFILTAGTDGLHAENSDDDTSGGIYIAGGTFTIRAADDGVHANSLLQIDNGTLDITGAEGLEATYIRINDGQISISASDDGVNATRKSSAYAPTVEINGGSLTVSMGAGDIDGVDSNGDIIITGGTVNVTGQSTFDYDGTAQYTGGVIIVNGEQVSSIPNQMMGGGMMGGGRMDGGGKGGGMMGGNGTWQG